MDWIYILSLRKKPQMRCTFWIPVNSRCVASINSTTISTPLDLNGQSHFQPGNLQNIKKSFMNVRWSEIESNTHDWVCLLPLILIASIDLCFSLHSVSNASKTLKITNTVDGEKEIGRERVAGTNGCYAKAKQNGHCIFIFQNRISFASFNCNYCRNSISNLLRIVELIFFSVFRSETESATVFKLVYKYHELPTECIKNVLYRRNQTIKTQRQRIQRKLPTYLMRPSNSPKMKLNKTELWNLWVLCVCVCGELYKNRRGNRQMKITLKKFIKSKREKKRQKLNVLYTKRWNIKKTIIMAQWYV